MPGISGLDVLDYVRSRHKNTMVIMITAVVDVNIAIKAMTSGAYNYLIKPIDSEILFLSVKRALERRSLMLENTEYQHSLEAKDEYTHGHSERVTNIAVEIAKELGLSAKEIEKIRLADLLHDIGKIGVREDILNKPGKLSVQEFEQVKSHSQVGEHILKPVIRNKDVLDMVIHHHERYDGQGYPDGLTNGQISLNASILAVADAYDAMTSDRPYRKALSMQATRDELQHSKKKQLRPDVVDALFRILDRGIAL